MRFSTVAARRLEAAARRRAGSSTAPAPRPAAARRRRCVCGQRVQQRRADVAGHRHASCRRARPAAPVSAVVVVLPLVPVIASTCGRVAALGLQVGQRLREQARARRCTGDARRRAPRRSSGAMRSSRGDRPGLLQHAAARRRAAPASNAPRDERAPAARCSRSAAACGGCSRVSAHASPARRSARTSAPSPGRSRRGRARARGGLAGASCVTAASGWPGRPGTAAS